MAEVAPQDWVAGEIIEWAADDAGKLVAARADVRTQLYNVLEALRKIEHTRQRTRKYEPGALLFFAPKLANVGAKTRNEALKGICTWLANNIRQAGNDEKAFLNILEYLKALIAYYGLKSGGDKG